MPQSRTVPRIVSPAVVVGCAVLLGACAGGQGSAPPGANEAVRHLDPLGFANRVTWGVSTTLLDEIEHDGVPAFLDRQLRADTPLPDSLNRQLAALSVGVEPLETLAPALEARRRNADAAPDEAARKTALDDYNRQLNQLAKDAAARSLMRALYSPNQLLEQMDWFWFNHFNIGAHKHDLRAWVGDYEDHAIRAHALGRFRDLLGAASLHPAMLRYLDNAQNAQGHINENFARELMELHTLGVDGGYTQKDVQELARILTGVGIRVSDEPPRLRREWQALYVRRGLLEFNPARHDFGDKVFLGHRIRGRGFDEVNEALDILARHPATAHFVCEKLARYFVADAPSADLVNRLAARFRETDGDTREVLRALFASPEFAQSLGDKFKDPMHYVVSSVRLAYDRKPILNTVPMQNWLNRLGEPMYGRQTPDGYPLVASAWNSAGQMSTRFDIARAIGAGSAGLFKGDAPDATERPAFPALANAAFFRRIQPRLSAPTRQALDQATSPQEWNIFLLSSPEMMAR